MQRKPGGWPTPLVPPFEYERQAGRLGGAAPFVEHERHLACDGPGPRGPQISIAHRPNIALG